MPIKFLAGKPAEPGLPVYYPALTAKRRREVRDQYVALQGGCCSHCGSPLGASPAPHVASKQVNWSLFPGGKSFLRYPIHLHHSHKSGMTLGAVHAYCNAVLWQYHGE